jgi:hypothetical protein
MESMQNTTNFAMMDGDGALSGAFDAEEEQLTDIPSEAGRDDYSPVDALRYRTQWLDASCDAGIDGHAGAEAGAGAGADVPAETGSQRNLRQGDHGGGGTEALGPKKRLAASTQKQISRLRMHPHETTRKPRRLHSHKINSDTGVPSLKADVPVTPKWNSQDDFSKGISRHALSVQDMSGQQPVLTRPWLLATTSTTSDTHGSKNRPLVRPISFVTSDSLEEPVKPKVRKKDKSGDAFAGAKLMFGYNSSKHMSGSDDSNAFRSSRNRFDPLILSDDFSAETSEQFDMMEVTDMHMGMAGPDTESHAENSSTYDLAGRRNLSDTWRIYVEESSDRDADGYTVEA